MDCLEEVRLSISICLLLMVACGPKKFPKPDFEQVDFSMTSSARLFFKNVRAYYYEADLYSFPGVELYRFKPVANDSQQVWLRPVLSLAYTQDKAFLLTEFSPFVRDSCDGWLYAADEVDTIRRHSLSPQRMEDHLALQAFLYHAIDDSCKLWVMTRSGIKKMLFDSPKTRQAIHKQQRDYLRLTGIIR